MIGSEWLFKWKCFVTNKISKTVSQDIIHEISCSSNSRIGILPPGPITNYTLFEQDGIINDHNSSVFTNNRANRNKGTQIQQQPAIKEELVVELDYKTVKKEVWSKFIKIYGGGPSIVREKPFIYSTPVEDNPIPLSRLRSPSPIETSLKGKRMVSVQGDNSKSSYNQYLEPGNKHQNLQKT